MHILHGDVFVRSIVDMRAGTELSEQIEELKVKELLFESFIVIDCKFKFVNIPECYGQVVISPGVVDGSENAVRYSNFCEDEKQSSRSFEDPFHISVVGQAFAKRQGTVKKLSLFSPELGHDEASSNLGVDMLVCPPELFECRMRRHQGVASIAKDACI